MTFEVGDGGRELFGAVVDVWLTGFGVSRGVPVRRSGSVAEVEVGVEGRRLELVVVEPDDVLLSAVLARVVGTTDVWSTILTHEPRRRELPPGVQERLVGEALMTVSLTQRAAPLPTEGRMVLEPDGDRAFARVLVDDQVAAEGQVALVGADAVFDRIGTQSAYRRRGLASIVMATLSGWAVQQGAGRGILAASVEGQALYTRLGWQSVGAMLAVAGSPGPDVG